MENSSFKWSRIWEARHFKFHGGSQLALGTIDDAISVAKIFVNTDMAACAGVVSALFLTQLLYKKVDLTIVFKRCYWRIGLNYRRALAACDLASRDDWRC